MPGIKSWSRFFLTNLPHHRQGDAGGDVGEPEFTCFKILAGAIVRIVTFGSIGWNSVTSFL
jgi:hypothetical protein